MVLIDYATEPERDQRVDCCSEVLRVADSEIDAMPLELIHCRVQCALRRYMEKNSTAKTILPDGFIMDIITVKPVKDSPKERVRQEVARQMIFEYQIAPESMRADFRVSVGGKSRKVDIAIFEAGKPHEAEFLRRVVVCRPEPKVGQHRTPGASTGRSGRRISPARSRKPRSR